MANAKPVILGENIIELGTPVATDTAAGYDVLNIIDRRPYTWWQAGGFGTKYLTVDCGAPVTADALGIYFHNLYTCAATISVECSSDNFAGDTTVALAGFTVTTDKAILKLFTSVSKRYWRLKLVTASVAARIAIAFLGDRVTFERYLSGNVDPCPEKILAESIKGNTGNLLGSTLRYIEVPIAWNFNNITPAWIESTFRPLWDSHLSQLKPVFLAWESTNRSTEVYFAKIPDDFTLSMPFDPYRRSLSLKFEGLKEAA
jgi:hypothetical protein